MSIRRLSMVAVALVALAAPAGAADDVTELPAAVEDVAVAGSGRTLVLKLKGRKELTVYESRTQKLRTIPLPTADFTFAAGGDTAIVFLNEPTLPDRPPQDRFHAHQAPGP